jgi:hypothetical protein
MNIGSTLQNKKISSLKWELFYRYKIALNFRGMWWIFRKRKKPDPVSYPFQFRIVYNSTSGIKFRTDLINVTVHARSQEEAKRIIRQIVPMRTEIQIIEK